MICEQCHITQSISTADNTATEPLSSFSSLMKLSGDELGNSSDQGDSEASMHSSPKKQTRNKWEIPKDLPIDLRVKAIICSIHLGVMEPVKVKGYPVSPWKL